MNKVCGNQQDYIPVREDRSRYVISYGLKEAPNNLYCWYEIYIYKKQKSYISFQDVKDAILDDINSQTDYKILTGLVWNDKPVWLSTENQFNFSEGERKAKDNPSILPVTYKIGQDADGNPVYHTFTTVEEIVGFYDVCFAYINQCLNEGWQRKDGIDWEPYKAYFPEPEEPETEKS